MKDRAMQALYLMALEPVAETTADNNSYGFRKERSTFDARGRFPRKSILMLHKLPKTFRMSISRDVRV